MECIYSPLMKTIRGSSALFHLLLAACKINVGSKFVQNVRQEIFVAVLISSLFLTILHYSA